MSLEEKVEQQKQLIIKAKVTIDRLRQDLQEKTTLLTLEKERNSELESIVQKYLSEDKSIQCERVIAKVKVEEIEWLLIKNSSGIEWVRQSEFDMQLNREMHANIQQLDYFRSKNDMVVLAQQYDQRMKIIEGENSKLEQNYISLKEKYQQLQNEYEETKNQFQNNNLELITQSEQIRETCLLYSQDEMREECETKIKLLLFQLQKNCNPILYALKQHLILLNQTIFELVKNQREHTEQLVNQEQEYQRKLAEIEEERSLERQQKYQHFESGRQQIKQLEQQVELIQRELREKNHKLEIMQQENKKNANIQYIKNVIIRFFTEDASVKSKTIPVIGTILQFTDSELQTVQNAWNNEQKSFIGKIFSK